MTAMFRLAPLTDMTIIKSQFEIMRLGRRRLLKQQVRAV